jgi:hypothetical protein
VKPARLVLLPLAAVGLALVFGVMFFLGLAHMCMNRVTTGRWWT